MGVIKYTSYLCSFFIYFYFDILIIDLRENKQLYTLLRIKEKKTSASSLREKINRNENP
jgi:hypothetical protein